MFFIGERVHLIIFLESNETIHLNWMLTREISVFYIFAAEKNWNKCIEIHDSHLTSGNINLKFKGVVVCSEAVWSYLNAVPSIRDKGKQILNCNFFETCSYITVYFWKYKYSPDFVDSILHSITQNLNSNILFILCRR